MKKIITLIMILLLACGCSSSNTEEPLSTGDKYLKVFTDNSSKNIKDIASALKDVNTDINMDTVEVFPGYLAGFSDQINDFNEGYMISPLIGSIPFVAYVFKTDDKESLKNEITEKMDMRWNICTQADSFVIADTDDLVFFMMYSTAE
ncbi:MAG: hypothetical protein Q4D13_04265 [Erysipelotrichaceae bacterium]|nr:hypothetical protein [Erysipelotrichaceae bacterium]